MPKTSRRRPLTSDELGDKGESRFKELCTDGKLIANKSVKDVMGWDYLVEFRYGSRNTEMPLDKRPHPFECKVQVKTVWSDTDHVDLTLSAAERLAKAAYPSFIVVLSIDEKLEPEAVYVFHMLNTNLEHVLRRLRKATAEGSLKINRSTLSFYLDKATQLPPDGASLRQFLMDACGDSTSAYRKEKEQQLETLGFGRLRYEGKFKLNAKNEKEVVEIFLGMREAKFEAFEAHEIRFDIKLPDFAADSGTLKITPQPVAPCRIIANSKDGLSATLSGDLYLPPGRPASGSIPHRISTPLLDIFVSGGDLTIDNRSDSFATTPVTTAELLAALKFHRIVLGGKARLTLIAKGRQMWSGEFSIAKDLDAVKAAISHVRLIEMMVSIFRTAGSEPARLTFSDVSDKATEVVFLHDLVTDGHKVKINPMTFQLIDDVPMPAISELLFIKRLRFDGFNVAYYAVMDVDLNQSDQDITVKVLSTSLRDVTVIDGEDDYFDAYAEEARLITGIEVSLIMHSGPTEVPADDVATDQPHPDLDTLADAP